MKIVSVKTFLICVFIISSNLILAQDERAQLPILLRNAYFGVSIGSINYDFGANEFQAHVGYILKNVVVSHPAVRLVLFGYKFNNYLSAQLTYMRPVNWVFYFYDRGYGHPVRSSVWMNVGGLTLKPELPINKRFSINGEVGLGLVTRHGFNALDGTPIISGVTYPSVLVGGGINYHLNKEWELMLSTTYSPKKTFVNQPATSFVSLGFNYELSPISNNILKKDSATGYINPKQWLQIGYSSNIMGYAVNNALEKAVLFWGGDAEVYQGISLSYHRNIFHAAKVFAIDWGVSASGWQTKGIGRRRLNPSSEMFFTLSVFPVFRFNFLRTKPLDAYFYYSVAGPTYISKITLDGKNTGEHFTFQDNMGVGIFFGESRKWNAEIKIGHYSNGNIFPQNAAVKVPLSLNFGYSI